MNVKKFYTTLQVKAGRLFIVEDINYLVDYYYPGKYEYRVVRHRQSTRDPLRISSTHLCRYASFLLTKVQLLDIGVNTTHMPVKPSCNRVQT